MLHVVFRLMKIARYLNTLEEALELEYRVMQHVIVRKFNNHFLTVRCTLSSRQGWRRESASSTIYLGSTLAFPKSQMKKCLHSSNQLNMVLTLR